MLNNSLSNIVDLEKARQEKEYNQQLKDSENPTWQKGHNAGVYTGVMIAYLEIIEAARLAGLGTEKELKEYAKQSYFPGGFLEAIGSLIVEGCRDRKSGRE